MESSEIESKIVWTEYCVANTYADGTIEMHKDLQLPKYKELKEVILKHELSHDFKKGFMHNLSVDMVPRVPSFKIWAFMITRPKTWIQVLPFYYLKDRGFFYDKNQIFFWGIILVFAFILIKLLGGI